MKKLVVLQFLAALLAFLLWDFGAEHWDKTGNADLANHLGCGLLATVPIASHALYRVFKRWFAAN